MFFHSLNNYNYEKFRIPAVQKRIPGTSPSRKMIRLKLPLVIILGMLAVSFFAVLNKDFFQIYFYQGYGYYISCLCIAGALLALMMDCRFRVEKSRLWNLLIIAVTLIYCFVSAILSEGGYRYVGAVFNTMGVVAVIKQSDIKKPVFKIIFILLCITTLYCASHIEGYYSRQFTENDVNSNYVAFFALVSMVYGNLCLIHIRKYETLKIQIVRLFFVTASFYIIWECQSRGALLSWLFYVTAVYVLPCEMFQNKRMAISIAAAIAFMGAAFTYFYVYHIDAVMFTLMGKSTGSRYRLWSYFWEHIFSSTGSMLLGYGTHSGLEELFGYGLHNIYIAMWYEIGLMGLIIFMLFILWNVKKAFARKKKIDVAQTYALIGLFSFMINDYFAITFTGPLVVWNYVLLGFLHIRKEAVRD